MKATKQKKLEASGWKVGSAAEFLDLSAAEEILVSRKFAFARQVRAKLLEQKLTQAEVYRLRLRHFFGSEAE